MFFDFAWKTMAINFLNEIISTILYAIIFYFCWNFVANRYFTFLTEKWQVLPFLDILSFMFLTKLLGHFLKYLMPNNN